MHQRFCGTGLLFSVCNTAAMEGHCKAVQTKKASAPDHSNWLEATAQALLPMVAARKFQPLYL